MLTPLIEYCGNSQLPGILLLEYASTANIDEATYEELHDSDYNWIGSINFISQGWMKMPLLPSSSKSWNETGNSNRQGSFNDQLIHGIVPNMRPTVSGEFVKMSNHRFLLRLTDKSNQKWLIGTLDNPLQFTASGAAGSSGDLKNYRVRFSAATPAKAYGLIS